MIYRCFLKRLFDIVLSTVGILIFSWVFVIIGLIIKCTSRGPILFKQKRVGKDKSYFTILKFRTMRIDTPQNVPTHLLEGAEQYITTIGRFLRKTSLDELPQLFNILFGDMALVGPRPALWSQHDLIIERELYQANSVRPGLTGLAQVSGRDELSIMVKANYDGVYVENICLKNDIILIFKTFRSVIQCSGIKEGGSVKESEEIKNTTENSKVEQEYAFTRDNDEQF